jgi:hypothetical protein
VFGRVVEGLSVVKRMEQVGSKSGRVSRPVEISDCGQVGEGLAAGLRRRPAPPACAAGLRPRTAPGNTTTLPLRSDLWARGERARASPGAPFPHPAQPSQLPGRLETAAKLKQEKEELEALKKDPTAVNPDDESRRRLEQIKQRVGGVGRAPAAAAADEDEGGGGGGGAARAKRAREEHEAAAAAPASGNGGAGEEDGGDEGGAAAEDGGSGDPFAGMSARQRKLMELRSKLQQCRKANEHAVIAERKRMQVGGRAGWHGGRGRRMVCACERLLKRVAPPAPPPAQRAKGNDGDEGDDASAGAKRRWYEEQQKKKVRGAGGGGRRGD